jgi:hypothetical protein
MNQVRKNILDTLGGGGRVEGEGFPTFKQVGVYMRFSNKILCLMFVKK